MVSEMVQNSQSSHSMLYLLFTNIFIHIQQLSSYSRNIFILIEQHISYSRKYLLTFTDVYIHIQRFIFVHIHNRDIVSKRCNIHSTFFAHPLCASLGPSSQRRLPFSSGQRINNFMWSDGGSAEWSFGR